MAEVERSWFRRGLSWARTPWRRLTRPTTTPTCDLHVGPPTRSTRRSAPAGRVRGRAAQRSWRTPRSTTLDRRHGHPCSAALDLRAHDRGVRPPLRSRRPDPRADRRRHRRLSRRLDQARSVGARATLDLGVGGRPCSRGYVGAALPRGVGSTDRPRRGVAAIAFMIRFVSASRRRYFSSTGSPTDPHHGRIERR